MKTITAVQFTRKRKKLTDYRKRLKLLLSSKERLVIRKTAHQIIMQIAKFDQKGDSVTLTVTSSALRKHGWQLGLKNIPAAYLTGLLAGKKAIEKGVKEAVLDAGTKKPAPNGRIYAALKGAIDAGLKIKAAEGIFPEPARLQGNHIAEHLKKAPSQQQHSQYRKNNVMPDAVPETIKAVKAKITGGK